MKIYTKKGDKGETSLYGGQKVSKDHLRLQTYGTLDELNSVLGFALSDQSLSQNLKVKLTRIQNELFQLGAELATPPGKSISMALIQESHILKLESEIDQMEAELSPLKTFILPGGAVASAQLHFARAVSRRAERELVSLHTGCLGHAGESVRPEVLKYINRLSDYLFVCARFANHEEKMADIPWIAPS